MLPAVLCSRAAHQDDQTVQCLGECSNILVTAAAIGATIIIATTTFGNVFWSPEASHPANWAVYWVLVLPQVSVRVEPKVSMPIDI